MAHLDSADSKLPTAEQKYSRRLHSTRCRFEFTKLVVSTRAAMQKFEASKDKGAALGYDISAFQAFSRYSLQPRPDCVWPW